jgi:hypothetical protein
MCRDWDDYDLVLLEGHSAQLMNSAAFQKVIRVFKRAGQKRQRRLRLVNANKLAQKRSSILEIAAERRVSAESVSDLNVLEDYVDEIGQGGDYSFKHTSGKRSQSARYLSVDLSLGTDGRSPSDAKSVAELETLVSSLGTTQSSEDMQSLDSKELFTVCLNSLQILLKRAKTNNAEETSTP